MIFYRRSAPLHFAVRIPAIAHYLGQILLASDNFDVGAR